ncbi:ABC transporter permease [Rhodococcus tukisamuensis]|uniref:Transport permease protein n=1 Tax=Rhodococcus tukisamuensis TaxID=168276 RepID=A0A1G7ABL0_9NOCA|nr:ABC transporter permease [Rhodococcus tukisamuensis]SDE12189.1 ABC-2 type transport system permease protein [Rhodococcus tukisamuensis]
MSTHTDRELTSVVADSTVMLRRNLKHVLRSPDTMLMAAALPIMLMLLFVYVFGGAIDTGTEYINYVVPGIILLCAAFGASTTAVSVSTDMAEGIIDRFRTLPIAQSSFLTGHVLVSVVRNLATTAIVIAVALLLGFRPTTDPLRWLGALGVIGGFIFALSYLSTALGLLAKNPEAASGFTFAIMFLPYVSSAFVPADSMPSWLQWFAENQPVTPIIETVRGLLMGTEIGNSGWLALGWCAAITVAGFAWSTVLYRRRVAA